MSSSEEILPQIGRSLLLLYSPLKKKTASPNEDVVFFADWGEGLNFFSRSGGKMWTSEDLDEGVELSTDPEEVGALSEDWDDGVELFSDSGGRCIF
ncbi:hypothetical protein TNIN_458881 [Trichonephila inaurata madagascariensis]|uniref:Uncharacterized protein n=1 Tax=Trichonephila inaurata madagascariensis TaxID=2747483 RepID=A0A8X6JL26_9ARAC|nr:hypothetical protein TNIN_458881 [Trichonephila inaurata madagascariensis]